MKIKSVVACVFVIAFAGCAKKGPLPDELPDELPVEAVEDSTESTSTELPADVEPTPAVEEPVVEAPAVEEPVVEAPVVEAPVVEAPAVEAPVVEEPVVAVPTPEESDFKQGATGAETKPAEEVAFKRPDSVSLDKQSITLTSPRGESLWNDATLSSRGLACASCHSNEKLYSESYAEPYPHNVSLVQKKTGVQSVDIDEMVNFCLTVSMEGEAMKWNSNDLLALTAEVRQRQKQYKDGLVPNLKNK